MGTDDEQAPPPTEQGGKTSYGQTATFRPAKREPLLVRTIPVSEEVPRYRIPSARRDLIAGLTVAALALPSAMAYGQLAGLSPVNGLYALLLPTVAWRRERLHDCGQRHLARRWAPAPRLPACSPRGAVAVILLFLTEPVQYLPTAVLGVVIVVAAMNIVDPPAWRTLAAIDRVEVAIAAVTLGCVVIFGVLEALVVAVGLSIIDTVRRSARPHDAVLGWVPRLEGYRDVPLHRSGRVTPGVVIYRLDDRLFYANARYVKGRVREAIRAAPTEASWLVFDAEAVNHVDSTGIEALLDLTRDLRGDSITLVVARLRKRLMPDFEAAGLADAIGPEHFYPSVRLAVAAFEGQPTAS